MSSFFFFFRRRNASTAAVPYRLSSLVRRLSRVDAGAAALAELSSVAQVSTGIAVQATHRLTSPITRLATLTVGETHAS